MATITRVFLCFSSIILNLVHTLAQSHNYIIHMDASAMPKAFSTQQAWHLSTLSSALDNAHASNHNNLNIASSKLIYTYTNAMNGFSANLSPKEFEALKRSPGYVSSTPDLLAKLDTSHSPKFLGLNPNTGAWPAAKFGEDVIVGVVDTGIWPESESFRDEGMSGAPSRWKGQCESSIKCNNKLIGARFFNKGLLAKHPNITNIDVNSTRDTLGHGTHTSSTAAGRIVEGASYFGYASGSVTGMASSARVAMYKALWREGTFMSDVIAAIDCAISDGVDVLSLSFGFDDLPLYDDPVAIATFAAMQKNIFVSTSAGNDGPFLGRLHNGIPWVITVAAGTMDREFHGTLTLGNGVQITGMSLYHGNFSSRHVPIVFMGLCDKVKELAKVRSKIVVCEDNGTIIDVQLSNMNKAKVVAAVLITNSYYSLFLLDNRFGTIFISPVNGEIIKAYIKRNSFSAKASMSFETTVLGTKPAPSVDFYSSRGPSNSCPSVLKPDITAPGSLILAAWPQNVQVVESQSIFNNFNLLSGTSMACPHVAGVAALLRGAHPDWSVASIRSAIMTTSNMLDNTFGRIKDIGDDNKPASPLASGSGHINPNKALNPGLVYDVGVQDYVNFLCALGYTQRKITVITGTSFNDCSRPSLDLNYPSFIAFFSSNNSWTTTQEFQRTVTNVGEGPASYAASFTPLEGYRVSVIPELLVFKEKYEKLSYTLRIEGPRKKKEKKVVFGYLTWTNVKYVVRSPIVVTTLRFDI
ncbi:hypothetical protein VNO80_00535 [Phaseolus coccineus]|uniref:Subtilisin-like protease SBT1.9 n=1 Tax=Phaseolus coccineus TaxID=3886 RepID=A0AAN9P5G6_PHACN